MNEKQEKGGWVIGPFIIASGLILFFNLWARSLENHDYLRYAEVAREMIRSGEWIVPHYNGGVYIDKPPLLFWLIAIPSSVYGSVTPLIARLPSAVAAWLGAILLFLWGKKVYGRTLSGLISGGILLTSYQYFFQARMAKTDMLLCLFILLSLYFFYLGYREAGRKRFLFHGLSFFFMGLGVLTKGPFGVLMPLFIMAAFLIKEGRCSLFLKKEFLLGYFILAMTVLPWVSLFVQRVGFDQTIALVKGSRVLSRHAPIYFYFVHIWGEFFPWSLLLPFLSFYLWKERERIWHSEESLFILWFVILFVLLTLFKFRATRYLLPALPPVALMLGGFWRKRVSTFLIPFLLFILVWHLVDFGWIRKDLSNSPGRVLAEQLRPLLGESTLFGYRLEAGTMEEVNFYLDRVIPLLKKERDLPLLPEDGGGLVLMPRKVYDAVRAQSESPLILVREFRYKGGELVLVSLPQTGMARRGYGPWPLQKDKERLEALLITRRKVGDDDIVLISNR